MMNFEIMEYFIWPFMIIALPLPFLVRWLLPPSSLFIKDNIPDSLRVSFFSELNQKKDVQNASAERKLKVLWITCWGLLVLASMRPILPQEDPTLREVRNIMLALDYSQSMEEKDFFLRDSDIITIYSLKDNQLISNINFNKFDYVREFIDNIIQFRFQHNKIKFSVINSSIPLAISRLKLDNE